ncbi:MAG: AAA family ATPase [Planctomycetes bacterium]|nr:AAA family ATPase [Planctomycetota bacterium]
MTKRAAAADPDPGVIDDDHSWLCARRPPPATAVTAVALVRSSPDAPLRAVHYKTTQSPPPATPPASPPWIHRLRPPPRVPDDDWLDEDDDEQPPQPSVKQKQPTPPGAVPTPSPPSPPALDADQQRFVDAVIGARGARLALQAPPGAGKSFAVDAAVLCLRASGRRVAVCASTARAAIHIGGVTLHSFVGLPPRPHTKDAEAARRAMFVAASANARAQWRLKTVRARVPHARNALLITLSRRPTC